MPVIRLSGFAGENRALHPKLLPDSVGTVSRNQKPGRGDLRPWKAPSVIAASAVAPGSKSFYRMGRDSGTEAQYWLGWSTENVSAVGGFDATDTTWRTYYTGDGAPKVTDNILAFGAPPTPPFPVSYRPLGVPAPSGACTAVASGGVSPITRTRYYVYTYVSSWGWESAPSPVSVAVTDKIDATTTLGSFATVPGGNYDVTLIRIYATQTGADGATEFFFLREIAYGTSTTTDDNRVLGEVCPTTTWSMPPTDLSNLTALWNGMLAGISGNAVRFCEPYTGYAWPVAYDVVPPDSRPLALGVFGQSLLVLTTGRPILVSGSAPDSMDQQLLEIPQACASISSVVSMGSGVAWASQDGLCWYGAGGAKLVTAGLLLREDWQALNPATIVGQLYEGLYLGSYWDGAARRAFVIDPLNPHGIYFLDVGYESMHFDEYLDQLYVLSSTDVLRWDAGSPMTARFVSKLFSAPRPVNFGCAEVTADAYPVTMKVYADGVLKHTQTVASRSPFRLPSGYMATNWQIEIEGTTAVQQVALATTIAELAQV